MDYGQMNLGSWASYLPVFKNVLRPSGAVDPVSDLGTFPAGLNEAITQARASSSGFSQLGDELVNLVFDGYQDWYGYDDNWILQELGQVLDDQGTQEYGLLSRLDAIVTAAGSENGESACTEFLSYAEQCAAMWRRRPRQVGTPARMPSVLQCSRARLTMRTGRPAARRGRATTSTTTNAICTQMNRPGL